MKKELRNTIDNNIKSLSESKKDFKAVYNIIYSQKEKVFSEYDDGFRIRKYTYGEVADMVERAAGTLYETLGAKNVFIGLESENCIEWVIGFWAILRSGNKPYLVNCRHPKSLADSIIKSLGITHILGIKHGELDAEYINVPALLGESKAVPDDVFADEMALSTSGTTLKPTVCYYSGNEVVEQVLNSDAIIEECKEITTHYEDSLKLLAFLPFYHVFGLFAVYFWFCFFGCTLVFLKDYSADTITKACRKHKVTHIFAVPMLWHTIEDKVRREIALKGEKTQKKFERGLKISNSIQNLFPRLGLKIAEKLFKEVTDQLFGNSIRFCISGGSYLRQTALELINGIGYTLYNGYGMSEVGITSVELRNKPKQRNLNSIGKPFGSVEYRINEDGTLSIKGSSICKKIAVSGEEIGQKEWIDTGDIAECIDGYYYIRGRKGDLVIGANGENINPDSIEQEFSLSYVRNYSILGLNEDGEEKLSMIVQISNYLNSEKVRELVDSIYKTNEELSMTMRVKKFYFTYDNIVPETAIKVSRPYLARGIERGEITLIPFSEALSNAPEAGTLNPEMKEKVRKAVATVLGKDINEIGDDTHFIFDLGASSLEYLAIVGALSKEFGITSYSEKEKYCYTVRECCKFIERYI